MRILAISDIHSEFEMLERLVEKVRADVLAVAGDVTHFRPSDVRTFEAIIEDFDGEILVVHGNCDHEDSLNRENEKYRFIHGKSHRIGHLTFHGLGGSPITPFNTPSEYPEKHYREILENLKYGEVNILLSHSPPYGILDRTYSGINAGNTVIRENLDKFDLIICGHIHESAGIERAGKRTLVVNPGPLNRGYYSIIEIDEGVHPTLLKLP
ncbi:metallophosphoesterase [Geoglobus acetivorans]|uniref:Metallophosphoesterase family protein n=1 Tax=Geoglobus acetivorans TaxID=565033 RepID=A0ABZ3H470_GEOAI|nr:metallophosphoesterase family protein [Geoglobus acetivorans]